MVDTYIKERKNSDGSISVLEITTNDKQFVNIGNGYKLVKFYEDKKSFKDTVLGSDIGINNHGFASMALIATVIAILTFISLIFVFRV